MAALPIMTASTPYLSNASAALSGEVTSPFPIMGIVMRGLLLTRAIGSQSASPVYICARVRPWIAKARMPTSCKRSAISSMMICSLSQPKRVLAVTGNFTAFTTCLAISTIRGTSRSNPAPAPFWATRLTGQPKFKSMKSGCTSSTIRAASTIESTKRPYIWMVTGRSLSSMVNFFKDLLTERTNASAETNSE